MLAKWVLITAGIVIVATGIFLWRNEFMRTQGTTAPEREEVIADIIRNLRRGFIESHSCECHPLGRMRQ